MSLSNLLDGKRKQKQKPVQHAEQHAEQRCKPEGSNRPVDDCSERTEAERRQPAACGTACGASDK